MKPLSLFLNGYKGRMGCAIMDEAPRQNAEITLKADMGDSVDATALAKCDVAVDFSFHSATPEIAKLCAEVGRPLVIGTTGHTPEQRALIEQCAQKIPIVWAGNYSVGVNLLNYLTQKAARVLGADYNVEIVEMHHRHKKDAPSGTAVKLVDIVRQARELSEDDVCYGRHGITGERPQNQIGMHALRGGDVVGDHTVIFAGEGERVELSHKASNRTVFAQGAVRAARWLAEGNGGKSGIHGMDSVLGLK